MAEDESPEGESTEGTGTGEVTAEELQQVQSEDQIGERYHEHFKPDYDKVPDDSSYAEGGAMVSEPAAGSGESEGTEGQGEESGG